MSRQIWLGQSLCVKEQSRTRMDRQAGAVEEVVFNARRLDFGFYPGCSQERSNEGKCYFMTFAPIIMSYETT